MLLSVRGEIAELELREILGLTPVRFAEVFRGTAIKRVKLGGLLRNACVVAGNSGDAALLPPLVDLARAHDLPLVRAHAVWAVYRLAGPSRASTLLRAAREIHDEDKRLCTAIGRYGADLLPDGDILTHCNTGALATGGDGTALAVVTTAWADGRRFRVWADETRPLFQGARLTAWELVQRGIPVTVLCDSAAAHLLATGRIGCCIVGADRITAGGDTANKIGTYGLAVLAAAHGVPFYVAAPSSTFDLSIVDGTEIPIEHRGAAEVTSPWGRAIAPPEAEAFNPAFDVTPARLIRGIITERGVIAPVTQAEVARILGRR